MTIHEAVFSPVRQPLLGALYLLMTAQMALLFAAFRDGRSLRFRFVCLLHFLVSFALLYPPMLDICWDINYPSGAVSSPAALSGFVSLPVWTLVLYEALTALILVAAFRNLFRYRKKHPTFESIKETMDLLPAGIAFGKPEGTVVFSNLAANALSRALTGKALTDLSAFRQAAGATGPTAQLPLPDGSAVWQLSDKALDVDGAPYIQLTATDITEQAAITRELEEKNQKLRDIHLRLDIYNKQADRIIIAQELLTARMAVHSEVGNVLLESRHYLTDPSSFDENKLLQALKNTNTYLLREYEEDDTARDALTDALEMAEAIGVDVLISGQARYPLLSDKNVISVQLTDESVKNLDFLISVAGGKFHRLMDQDFFNQGVQQFNSQLGGILILLDQIDPLLRILDVLVLFLYGCLELADLFLDFLLFCLILLRKHLEVVFRDAFIRPILVHLGESAIHVLFSLLRFFQLGSLLFEDCLSFPIRGAEQLLQKFLLVRMGLFDPILDAGEDMLIQHVVADGVGGACACDPAVLAVIVAVVVTISGVRRDRRYHHGLPAIRTFQQAGEDLRLRILHGPAAVPDLLLHLPEYICVNDGLMGSFHPKPVIRRFI